MPENVVEIYKKADEKAAEYAGAYQDEPIQYLVGSGNLEDWAVCYGMCIMEEMQWVCPRHINSFYHGTLEVIDRDTSVILIKGEDKTRPYGPGGKFCPQDQRQGDCVWQQGV